MVYGDNLQIVNEKIFILLKPIFFIISVWSFFKISLFSHWVYNKRFTFENCYMSWWLMIHIRKLLCAKLRGKGKKKK